jgi:hypothetical protein
MTYKKNDLVLWEGPDEILTYGNEYIVDMVRDGRRVQEFTLKFRNGKSVGKPVIWWEVGAPFVKRQKATEK